MTLLQEGLHDITCVQYCSVPRLLRCHTYQLVGGFNHLENISQWEGLSHILLKIKNVPNHQPVIHMTSKSALHNARLLQCPPCHTELSTFSWRLRTIPPHGGSTVLGGWRYAKSICQVSWEGLFPIFQSLDWGKICRKPWFLPLNMGVSCKFFLKPIHWNILWTNEKCSKPPTRYGLNMIEPYPLFPCSIFCLLCLPLNPPRQHPWLVSTFPDESDAYSFCGQHHFRHFLRQLCSTLHPDLAGLRHFMQRLRPDAFCASPPFCFFLPRPWPLRSSCHRHHSSPSNPHVWLLIPPQCRVSDVQNQKSGPDRVLEEQSIDIFRCCWSTIRICLRIE